MSLRRDGQPRFRPPVQSGLALAGGKSFRLSRDFSANWRRVEKYWSELFAAKRKTLERELAKGQVLKAKPGHGLIYTYRIDGKVRYVGRTKGAITRHLRHGFRRGLPTYGYDIKRCLLNAAFRGGLSIRTETVPLARLQQRQAELIRLYSRCNRLWNKLHNPYFRQANFDS